VSYHDEDDDQNVALIIFILVLFIGGWIGYAVLEFLGFVTFYDLR